MISGSGETVVGRVSADIGDVFYFSGNVSGNAESGYVLRSAHDLRITESGPAYAERQHYDIADYPYFMKGSSTGSYYYTVQTPDEIPITFGHWHNYYWFDDWSSVYAKAEDPNNLDDESAELIGTYPTMIRVGNYQEQGSLVGNVYSTSSSAYPNNGISGSYWYVRYTAGDRTTYSKGSANGSVTSTDQSAYPQDGRSGSYWYTANGYDSSYSQGTFIDEVSSTDPSAYPDNGRHTDGYWYVKQ